MRIAIHINSTLHHFTQPFNHELALAMAGQYPEDEFLLIYDDEKGMHGQLPKNCVAVAMKPRIRNNLLLRYWYGFRIHKLLPRFKPEFFIPAGDIICPKTKVPQALIFHRNRTAEKKMRRYLLKHREKFSKAAYCCFRCGPDISVGKNTESFPMLKPGLDQRFGIIGEEEKKQIRDTYTAGKEFFIYWMQNESELPLITLLKSFSIFKKWQQSEMRLIILSADSRVPPIEGFENYKYKEDVLLMARPDVSTAATLLGSAYAGLTDTAIAWNDPGFLMMASGVPVISVGCGQNDSQFENAALRAACDETDISTKWMQVYKNEELRSELIRAGSDLAKTYDWAACARTIREGIKHS
jgi:hypothetical protein